MFSTLLVVLPVFALVLAGWLARRLDLLGGHATGEPNRFVVYLALPALLFDILAHARWEDVWQPKFIAVFGLGVAIIFAGTVLLRLRRPLHLADAALDGLNAAYGNTGFIGFPLVIVALGRDALAVTTVATLLTVCLLFAVAIVLIEIGLQEERGTARIATKVLGSLVRNPILLSTAAGALVPLSGIALPVPVETFLKLLGGAATPCALVALGLFLAESRAGEADPGSTGLLVGLKLLAHPIVTWILATLVFELSPSLTRTAVLLAALPTGTGPFMLAEFYRREAVTTSRTILISTTVAVFTVSAYLALSA